MPGVISDHDIERELQTLRNLRRRSISTPGPGALAVDPDLPPSPPSSTSSLHTPSLTSNDDVTLAAPDGLDDGSLFWVPAHLHPELAPGEFKAFLKSHAHPDAPLNEHGSGSLGAGGEAGDAPGLARSPSWLARSASGRRAGGADGLGRKRSMLSRQYTPRPGDDADENAMPSDAAAAANAQRGNGSGVGEGGGRQRGSIYGGRNGERGLTLQDLQRLETLVDGVEDSDDPAQVRSLLRRSLSMNVAPGFLQDDIPQGEVDDTHSSSPRSGSIMRRNARTRLRKGPAGPGESIRGRLASSRRPKRSNEPDSEASSADGHGYSSRRPSASTSAEGGDLSESLPTSRKSSDGSDEHSASGSGSASGETGENEEGRPLYDRGDMSIESYEYEERFSDRGHHAPGQGGPSGVVASMGAQAGSSGQTGTGTGARQTSYGSAKHIEHRRSQESLAQSSETEEGEGEGASDTDGIFDAYRNSRASSISSDSDWGKSADVSPSPTPSIDSSDYAHQHVHTPPSQGQGQDKKLSLPPLPLSTSYGNDWFAAQGEGEKTPTQESARDPMGLGLGIRGEGGAALKLDTGAGMGQATPRAGGRDAPAEKAPSPTTPQARRQPLPSVENMTLGSSLSASTSAGYDLPPGMAPPATRQAIPPGIALQHQRSHEKLGPVHAGVDSRPALARTESNVSAAPSIASSSSSSILDKKDKPKEKEKKSGLFGKKDKKDKDKDKDGSGKKKEKEGFLGSLFGHKKKTEESSVANFATAGPAAAAALLGSSKSAKSLGTANAANGSPQISPATPGAVFSPFARYPIHVERAVYRLSHIKLANARRPLYEQVLISNLMFWYLGVIGRNVAEEKKANASAGSGAGGDDKDGDEVKKGPVPVVVKGTPPKPADRGDANGYAKREKQMREQAEQGEGRGGEDAYGYSATATGSPKVSPPLPGGGPSPSPTPSHGPSMSAQQQQLQSSSPSPPPQVPSSGKKSLVKPERRPGGRGAEHAVQMPSYGMQNAQVDSEMRQREAREREREREMQRERERDMQREREREREMERERERVERERQQQQQQYAASPQYAGQQAYPRQLNGPHAPQPQHNGPDPARSPERTRSPPQPGQHTTNPSGYPSPHSQVQGPTRGVPQSSFGPPPPASANPAHAHPDAQMRQRTLSSPAHGQAPLPPGGAAPGMRRVVTEGRPEAPRRTPSNGSTSSSMSGRAPQHSGPQPGQIFQYPGGAGVPGRTSVSPPPIGPHGQLQSQPFAQPQRSTSHPQPGQIYSPGPGPAPGQMYRPPPGSGQGQMGGPPRPMPSPGMPPGQEGWQQPQRLPMPGQHPQHPQHPQHMQQQQQQHQPQRLPPPGAAGPQQGQGYPHSQARPPPGQQVYYARPPPQGYPQQHAQHAQAQGYPHPHPQQRPPPQGHPAGQGYNPHPHAQHAQQPPPQGYGRQPVTPVPQGYAHHR